MEKVISSAPTCLHIVQQYIFLLGLDEGKEEAKLRPCTRENGKAKGGISDPLSSLRRGRVEGFAGETTFSFCIHLPYSQAFLSFFFFQTRLAVKNRPLTETSTKDPCHHFEAFLCCHERIPFFSCCDAFHFSSKLAWESRDNPKESCSPVPGRHGFHPCARSRQIVSSSARCTCGLGEE